jgi:3-dehydroquinate synthetase
VWAGLETLTTLPDRERRAGLGEVLKTALLDRRLWARVERDAERLDAMDPETLADVVTACIRIKARIVEADERESGPRAVLNLGHTIAHGLEAACGYETLLHGEAVALGLVAEARWAVHSGVCDDDALPGRIASVAARMGLPARAPRVSASSLLAAMRLDKKVRQGILRLPVPIGPGQTAFVDLPFDRFHELVAEIP